MGCGGKDLVGGTLIAAPRTAAHWIQLFSHSFESIRKIGASYAANYNQIRPEILLRSKFLIAGASLLRASRQASRKLSI
jgi:hypothetical protein